MKNLSVALALATVSALTIVTSAHAEADEGHDEYAKKNDVEVGGSISTNWTKNLFTFDIDPTLGWFVVDGVEMSLIVNIGYENRAIDNDERASLKRGSVLLEPSYHFPISHENVFAFAGLGIGPGYDGEHVDLELVPRLGMNIEVGSSAILSPALRVPLLYGKNQGPGNDDTGLLVGFGFELGLTTTI